MKSSQIRTITIVTCIIVLLVVAGVWKAFHILTTQLPIEQPPLVVSTLSGASDANDPYKWLPKDDCTTFTGAERTGCETKYRNDAITRIIMRAVNKKDVAYCDWLQKADLTVCENATHFEKALTERNKDECGRITDKQKQDACLKNF